MRPFPDLAGDLVADARRAADVGELELEALGFALAFEAAAQDERDAADVVRRLSAESDPHADAALRALALYGSGALRDAATGVDLDLRRAPARDVGRFEVEGAWRTSSDTVVAHLARLARPDGSRQSLILVTGPDALGAPLLAGGLGGAAPQDDPEAWLAGLVASLGTGPPEPTDRAEVVERMRRGAATNAALLVEVSATLAMAARVAGHALAGSSSAVPDLPWPLDETESDDDRAAYLRRLLSRAVEDGVDPTDAEALGAWFAAFQQRPPGEQLRRLGLPGPAPDERPAHRRGAAAAQRRAKRRAARNARRRNR